MYYRLVFNSLQNNNNGSIEISKIIFKSQFYVDSWRWHPLSENSIKNLTKNNRVLFSKRGEEISIGFLIKSRHFENLQILTIIKAGKSVDCLLHLAQSMCFREHIQRIQVLTPLILPEINGLEKRTQFYLMHKKIRN